MNKLFIILALVAAATITYISFLKKSKQQDLTWAMSKNIEALSTEISGEYYDKRIRESKACTIDVGVNGRIKLLNGTIIKAGASGKIIIDGEIICRLNGDCLCSPVECKDLYEVIF